MKRGLRWLNTGFCVFHSYNSLFIHSSIALFQSWCVSGEVRLWPTRAEPRGTWYSTCENNDLINRGIYSNVQAITRKRLMLSALCYQIAQSSHWSAMYWMEWVASSLNASHLHVYWCYCHPHSQSTYVQPGFYLLVSPIHPVRHSAIH